MNKIFAPLVTLALLTGSTITMADIVRSSANNGQLLMEDVPAIPQQLVDDLNRYQNVRSAGFLGWADDSESIYISTRFGDVNQLHQVTHPGGARNQMTFFKEPVRSVTRQPDGTALAFTMDAGGNEFSQIFLLDPAGDSKAHMISDGEALNSSIVWDQAGKQIAFRSTRRNGSSNDVWVMNPLDPASARMVLAAPDGTYWTPADFSSDGKTLLIENHVGNADSRILLLDLDSGDLSLLAGGPDHPGRNTPIGFDARDEGFWYTTDATSEFRQLAWQPVAPEAEPEVLSAEIPWHVEGVALSEDRKRGAFVVNEQGFSRLYLFDPQSRRRAAVSQVPVGIIGSLAFSPDGKKLGMTLNSSQNPSDAFVLSLQDNPVQHSELTRWTFSEVGGLKTDQFIQPSLVSFPTFDSGSGGPESIPAWLYEPPGKGPHPVVISIHGGPESQARPYFISTYQIWMQQLGVAVLVPNVRGSNGYGKHYMGLDNGYAREDSVKDIGALLDWIDTQPSLDSDRVAVTGGSYGGYMVLASAVHYGDRLRAAVDRVGISNFVTFLENTQDYRRDARRAEYGDERDPEMRAHLQAISPLNHADKIRVPMFVVQGHNDPRVPVTESEQIVAALRKHGQSVWYMNALNEGHGYRKKENRDIYQQATVLFLQQHLLPPNH